MKKIILFSIFILCCSSTLLHAQVPGGIMFQAVARDVNGNIASERNIHIKVNIQTDNNSNTSVYSEIFEVISSKEGIFSVVIGNGNWLSGANSIIDLDWNNNIYYLNLNVAVEPSLYDPSWNYQDKYVDLGTSQIWSVPYSFNAETANNINGILSGENGGTGVNNEGKTISLDGNLSLVGDFNLTINTTADSNITLPTSGTLATISDVTSEILSVNSNLFTIQEEIDNTQLGAGLQNDGSYVPNTSANYINTATNLSNASEILDNQISLNTSLIQNINNQKLNLTGGVMSGTLDMGSNSITNIASPINNQDAANKIVQDTKSLNGKVLRASTISDLGSAFVTPGFIDMTDVKKKDKEIFGPVLQVIRVPDWNAAIYEANDTNFGLSAGLISNNKDLWESFQQNIRAGIVNFNRPTTGAASFLPFGGPGFSGNHNPGAYYSADFCAWPMASQISDTPSILEFKGLR